MENQFYRNILVHASDYFGDKVLLNAKEVADYLKIDPRTARTRYHIPREGIHISKLCQMLAK